MSIPSDSGATLRQFDAVSRHLNTFEREMTMTRLSAFLKDETGAVTVDWVVLTAAVVGLGLLIFNFVRPAVSNLAEQIGTELESAKTCMTSDGKTC
jgi:Flp pilus assembly pilin Flp